MGPHQRERCELPYCVHSIMNLQYRNKRHEQKAIQHSRVLDMCVDLSQRAVARHCCGRCTATGALQRQTVRGERDCIDNKPFPVGGCMLFLSQVPYAVLRCGRIALGPWDTPASFRAMPAFLGISIRGCMAFKACHKPTDLVVLFLPSHSHEILYPNRTE